MVIATRPCQTVGLPNAERRDTSSRLEIVLLAAPIQWSEFSALCSGPLDLKPSLALDDWTESRTGSGGFRHGSFEKGDVSIGDPGDGMRPPAALPGTLCDDRECATWIQRRLEMAPMMAISVATPLSSAS